MPVKKPTLAETEPGSIEELVIVRQVLIDRLAEAGAPYVSSITAKLLEVGARISEVRQAESRKLEESLGVPEDEDFDPESV